MSGYFELLEEELRTATERAAVARGQTGQRSRPWTDGAALASAIAVTLLVAILAVTLLGHSHRASNGPVASEPASQSGLRRLVEEFGILRRPQSRADRPPREWRATLVPSGTQLVPGLTRLATTLATGERVFVGVEQSPVRRGSHRASSYVLGVFITGPNSYGGSASFDPGRGYASFPAALGMRRNAHSGAWIPTWVSVVPDGVRSVRWTFFASRHGRYQRQLTLTVPAAGNIAAAPVAGTGTTNMVQVVWKNAAGGTIRTYLRAGLPAAPATQTPSIFHKLLLRVLRPDGIGNVRFGAPPAAVRAAIDSLIRQHGGQYTAGGSCEIDHEIKWWDQWTASGEPALTVFFHRSAFAGYQFGDPPRAGVLRRPPSGWQLATTRDLRIGDTVARGRQLYGRAFAISAAQGGTWSTHAPGLVKGYSWGTPNQTPLSSQRTVATIDAGDVGCPATSP